MASSGRTQALLLGEREYRDINLNLRPHPATGDFAKILSKDAIKRSVRNIVLTNTYERHYSSDFGANVTALLFEPATPLTAVMIKSQVEDTLKKYEPRIRVEDVVVSVSSDESGYNVSILFSYKDYPQPAKIDLFLERVR
jgi:phage baseplate assembly protein W